MTKRIAVVLFVAMGVAGCQPDTSPTERVVKMVFEKAVGPAIEKGMSELSTTSGQLQGGAQAVEPGYEFEFEGFWVTGVKGKATAKAIGVSGQVQGAINATGKHLPGGNPGTPFDAAPGQKSPADPAPVESLKQLN